MGKAFDELAQLLALETLDIGLFRGKSLDLGFGHVFGGQVLGQALSAAKQTVGNDREVHSLHSYFLRPGDYTIPIIYDVEVVREGASFTALRVKAVQKGVAIFYMTASFQIPEVGFLHQSIMPDVAGPENLLNHQQLAQAFINKIPDEMFFKFTKESAIELRPVDPVNPLNPIKTPPKRFVWIRANGNIKTSSLHQHLLAYASDFDFLSTAAQPHGVSFFTSGVRMATIDHAIWFHRTIDMNDWLLYSIDSPNASGGRAFVRGEIFNRKGDLLASTTQEGLLRKK